MIAAFLLMLLCFDPVSISGNEADLTEFFRSQSIPVTAIENQAGVVVIKANFPLAGNPDLAQLQPMLSTVFSKTAQAFPSSSRIQVDYSIENELVASLAVETKAFLNPEGAVDRSPSLFSDMTVQATDRALAAIHEGWSTLEGQTEDLVDRDAEEEARQEEQGEPELSDPVERADDGLTAYFGVVFARHDGEGILLRGVLEDLPAQNTGLRKGDIILELENISVRDKGARPEEFSDMVQSLPPDRPLRFHIEREGKRFDVWIKPLRLDQEQLAAYNAEVQEKFGSDYARGTQLMDQKNYSGAIEYFQRSLKSDSWVMESYRGLGICCFYLGRHKEARKHLENALKMDKKQPLSWFYGALNMDALNRRNGAIDGYKRYLKLNHDNAEMNAFARERLEQLRQGRRFEWNKRLLDVIDAIRKEIKN